MNLAKRIALVLVSAAIASCGLEKPIVYNQAGRVAEAGLQRANPPIKDLAEHNRDLREEAGEQVTTAPGRQGSGVVGEINVDKTLSKGNGAGPNAPKAPTSAVKLDFFGASLREVVAAFMDYLKQPFSFQDSFKDRKVNLYFDANATRDELIQLFEALLENYGVKLRYSSGIYYVGSLDDKGAPLQQPSPLGIGDAIGVFRLNFVDAKEFQTLAKQVVRFPDKISVLPGNVVVVMSTGTDVRAVRTLRDDLDIPVFAGKYVLIYAPRYLSAASVIALLDSGLALLSGVGGQGTTKQFEAKQIPETERITIVAANKTARDLVVQILNQSDVAGASYRRVFQYVLVTQSPADIVTGLNLLVKAVIKSPGEVNIVPDKVSNSLFVYASPEEYVEIRKLLSRMDYRPPAVYIDMIIAEVDLTNAMQYGVEYFLKGSGKWLASADQRLGFDVATTGGLAVGIISAANNFATLQLLGTQTSFTLLSSPKLVVRNGASAKILVGSEQPVIQTKVNTSVSVGNANTVIQPEYKKIGLEMEVTPYVSSTNDVRLVIKLKDTAITGQVLLAGDQYPILANRELSTDLVTADGRTVFLGGIRRQDVTDSSTRIPGPADLPGVGVAFRNKNMNNTGSELIILATATVILDQQGADIVTRAIVRAARESFRDLRELGQPANAAAAKTSATPTSDTPAASPAQPAKADAKASTTQPAAAGVPKSTPTTR